MRTLILTHGDTDGICSGALALAANPGADVFFTSPVSLLDDLAGAAGYDQLVISDVAINISTSERLKDTLDTFAARADVIYLDHHPLPDGFEAAWLTHDEDACGSLLVYDRFQEVLDPNMSRVAMYGAIGDFRDDTHIARDLVRRWDRRSLYYEAGTLSQGEEMERRNYDFKRRLAAGLARNILPSEMPDLARNAVLASKLEDQLRGRVEKDVVSLGHLAYVTNPDGFISKAAIYARIYGNRPVGLAAEYREGKKAYDLSVRADGDFDLNRLLNDAAAEHGGHAGGNPEAGGGRIPADRLRDFLQSLDEKLGDAT